MRAKKTAASKRSAGIDAVRRGPSVPMSSSTARPGSATDIPIASFADKRAWTAWLVSNGGSSRGVWLRLAKKGSGLGSVTYDEALQAALAWGWIDGQKRSLDEAWWLQKFTPRGPKSIWSKVNRDNALALIKGGHMRPAGLAEVERAKHDGRWDAAYDSPRSASAPADLTEALQANARAAAFFAGLDARNRYAVLFRIQTAKKAETRAKHVARFVEMFARHEKLYP